MEGVGLCIFQPSFRNRQSVLYQKEWVGQNPSSTDIFKLSQPPLIPSIRFDLFKRYKVNFFNVYLPGVLKTGLPKIFRQDHHIAGNLSNPGIDRNQWKFQKTCTRGAYFLRAASVELSVLLLHRHRAIIWYAFLLYTY